MESGAENKYLIDSDSYEMFDNITRFAKNVKLKDSKKLYNAENALSSEFGRLLLKYYDSELTNEDIISLVTNVNDYNKNVDIKFNNNKNKYIFGIPEKDSTEKIKDTSLFKKIINKIKSDVESIEDVSKDDVNLVIPNIIYTAFNTTDGILDTDETVLENICESFGIEKPTTVDEKHNECKNFTSMINYYKDINPYEIICNISNSDNAVSDTNEKRSASAQETTWMESGEQVLFFDLRNIKMTKSEITTLGITGVNPDLSVLAGEEDSYTINIFVIYKELNNEYRKILNSAIQERVLSLMDIIDDNTSSLNSKYFSTKNIDCIASSTFESTYRNFKDSYGLLITPNTEMDIYRYLYANAYIARKAEESGIIAYYYGDNYTELSNGYGQYSYEKEEIKNFLNIYEETRLYFYKVLLNKSFINESYYHTYEKSFIIFTAIERFLSNKNDTLKDIESMNITDMKNFMESYGLKDLSDIISDTRYGDFINKEKYIRRLLHNYTNLLHEKGSRAVIDRLLTIFDYNSTDIDITKYLIYDNEFSSANYESKEVKRNNDNNRLKFVETKYFADDNNATRSIIESIPTTNKSYNDFLKAGNDKYWLPSDSEDRKSKLDESDILLSGLSVSETKYLSLKVSENLSDVYMNSRYFISYIDGMKDKGLFFIGSENSNGNITSIDGNNNSIFSLYNAIQFVFKALNTVYGKTIDKDTKYWINFTNLESDYNNASSDDVIIKKYISVKPVSEQQNNSNNENAQTKMFCLNSDTAYQLLEHTSNDIESHPKVIDSLKTLNNMIRGLTLLILDDTNPVSKNTRLEILNEITGQKIEISLSEYPSYNIEHALSFIHSYVSGELLNTTLPVTSEYYKLCHAIFNRYFMIEDNGIYGGDTLEIGKNDKYLSEKFKEYSNDISNIISSSSDNTYTIGAISSDTPKDSLISALSSLLIELINAANTVFNTDISDYTNVSFSMEENISRVLNFMEATITYFISYTTQIRDSNYIQILDSKIEKYIPSDNIGEITLNSTDIDNVFYDEQFELTKQGS